MARVARLNPADVVLRARLRETVHFPDLTERLALKLSAIPSYTARSHFGLWHKKLGAPNFEDLGGVFTPLVAVELDASDVRVDPRQPLRVRGETFLAKTLDAAGAVRHLLREGRHELFDATGAFVGRARFVNVFTRYDSDPAKRRVTHLPPRLGLGAAPSRLGELPQVSTFVPADRPPDYAEDGTRVWHYGQTDANRHVNGVEYLRVMEQYAADVLASRGIEMARAWFARARIVYRKPCFRGEGYRRAMWVVGASPLTVVGVFRKAGEPDERLAAVAIELTVGMHPAARPRRSRMGSGG